MIVFLSRHKRKSAHQRIALHASNLLMNQWDTRMYVSMFPDQRQPNDVEQIITMMNQHVARRQQDE